MLYESVNSLQNTGASSAAHFLSKIAGTPSRPQAFDVSRSRRILLIFLTLKMISGIDESILDRVGGSFPWESRVEFRANIEANKSAFSFDVMAIVLSSPTRGGKLEEVKFFPTDFANAQKDFEPEGQFKSLSLAF